MSMQDEKSSQDGAALSRRHFLSGSAAALAATVAVAPLAAVQQTLPARPAGVPVTSPDHHLPNEQQPGANNSGNDALNPDSVYPPLTDNGTVLPFKYSFDQSHKEIDSGGWRRQVPVRDLPVSKTIAGVEMRLIAGGVRELHWHVSAE